MQNAPKSVTPGGLYNVLPADQQRQQCTPMSAIVSRGCSSWQRQQCVVQRGHYAHAFRSIDFDAIANADAHGFNGMGPSFPMHKRHAKPFALYRIPDRT